MATTVAVPADIDFLAARLHGRRSRLAEGAHLDELCRIRTVPELARALNAPAGARTAVALQRHLVAELIREVSALARGVSGRAQALLAWQRVRFQVENLKVLARGFVQHTPLATLTEHLVELPADLVLDAGALVGARSVEQFAAALPAGVLQAAVAEAGATYTAHPTPFILEAALDAAWLREQIAAAGCIDGDDGPAVLALARQEADMFHLMLALRGRLQYGLAPALLAAWHVGGAGMPRRRFEALLGAPDVATMARLAGAVVRPLPPEVDAPTLELLAVNRLLRLGNGAFRRSHLGVGAAIGYVAVRRVELANLITLTEGLRLGVDPQRLRARLIPCAAGEAARV